MSEPSVRANTPGGSLSLAGGRPHLLRRGRHANDPAQRSWASGEACVASDGDRFGPAIINLVIAVAPDGDDLLRA
jgi:hypothetical protein